VQPSNYPTNLYATAQRAGDAEREVAYGEIGALPAKIVEALTGSFQTENAPNPHDVAEAIVRIVEQPNGSRPARMVVGPSYGADAINAQAATIQTRLIDALGLGQLATRREGSGRRAGSGR
jgi:hypothetical protein